MILRIRAGAPVRAHRRSIQMNPGRLTTNVMRLLLLANLAVLCGCGGGGAAAPAPLKAVQLQGVAVDAPLAGAAISAAVGSRMFTTTANAAGEYLVHIEVPADQGGQLVTLVAAGTGAQDHVRLTSLAGSVDALIALAGADNILQASESPAVNLTQVSTADAALTQTVNGGPPTTAQQLDNALRQVDPFAALELAAAIKLLADDPDGFPLPAGIDDTLELAQSVTARERVVSHLKSQNAVAFQQAQRASTDNPAIAPPPVVVPQRFYAVSGRAVRYTHLRGPAIIAQLDSDHTGRFVNQAGSTTVDWEVQGNAVRITLDEPSASTSFRYDNDPVTGDPVNIERTDTTFRYDLRTFGARGVEIRGSGTSHFRQTNDFTGEVTERDEAFAEAFVLARLFDSDFLPVDATGVQALTLYEPTQFDHPTHYYRLITDVLIFAANGSGTTRLFAHNFTWTQPADQRELSVTLDNGSTATYRKARAFDAHLASYLVELQIGAGERLAVVDLGVTVDPSAARPAAEVPGAYFLNGVGVEDDAYDPLHLLKDFWLEFYANATGRHCLDDFVSEDGVILRDQDGTPQVDGGCGPSFFWGSDGAVITNLRTYDTVQYSYGCHPEAPDCVIWDRRESFILAVSATTAGERVYVLQRRTFDSPTTGIDESTPVTHDTRIWDVRPLPVLKGRQVAHGGGHGIDNREQKASRAKGVEKKVSLRQAKPGGEGS